MENIKINNLKYDSNGLIPTVVQERETKEILMVAYSNKESLEMTIKNNFGYFWSRSKNKLWKKGETSGCLLYTSPSPRDRSLSRMPSSA